MKYLLDTHTFLWTLFDTSRLPKKVMALLENSRNDVYVSTVSFWEISLKYSIGKLSLENVLPDELPHYARQSGFEIANINEKIVSTFYRLPKSAHCDPFDRLLIWQAINSEMVVITKDDKFDNYFSAGLKTVWK